MREGWTRAAVGDLFEVQLGKMLSPKAKTGSDPKPYLGNAHVQWGHFLLDNLPRMDFSSDERAKFALRPGDLLMCEGGEIGRCAIWQGALDDCYYQKAVHRLRPRNGRIDTRFAAHCFEHSFRHTQTFTGDRGQTTIAHLPKERLERLEILIPPLDEQRRIAALLSAIDTVRERQTKCADAARNLMGACTSALMGPGVPKAPLGELCERITDGTHQAVKVLDAGEVPFLYVSCVRDGVIRWHHAKRISQLQYVEVARGREPRRGDVLYTAVGSYGHAALVPDDRAFAFQRHIAFIRPDLGRLDASYLVHWLNSPAARSHVDTVAVGNAQKTITLGALRDLPVPVPPLHEQRRVGGFLDAVQRRVAAEEAFAERYGDVKAAVARTLLGATG